MTLLDLKNFKLSKIVCNDLPVALANVEAAIRTLEPYKRYKSVANCLRVLQAERETIKTHLEQFEKIKKSKGEVRK